MTKSPNQQITRNNIVPPSVWGRVPWDESIPSEITVQLLALTVLLVSLQAHDRHKGQKSRAQVCLGRWGNRTGRRRVWWGFRQVGGISFHVVKITNSNKRNANQRTTSILATCDLPGYACILPDVRILICWNVKNRSRLTAVFYVCRHSLAGIKEIQIYLAHTRRWLETSKTWLETLDAEFGSSWRTSNFSSQPWFPFKWKHSLVHHVRLGWGKLVSTVALAQDGLQLSNPHRRWLKKQSRDDQLQIQARKNNCPFKSSACIGGSCGLGSPHKYPNICKIRACGQGVRSLEKHPVRTITAPPHPNDFADMLETLFAGNTVSPERPVTTPEAPWQRSDLTTAIPRMKT